MAGGGQRIREERGSNPGGEIPYCYSRAVNSRLPQVYNSITSHKGLNLTGGHLRIFALSL